MKYLKTYKLFENVVRYLDYTDQDRKSLPKLPDTLIDLFCFNNRLKFLPKLPKSLQRLSCSHNILEYLPELPESLEHLHCFNNKLKFLPELPESLKYLDCSRNPLECIIPDKFIHYQDEKWLEEYYYPMIKSYEFQKKILDGDITQLIHLKNIGLNPKIKEEYIGIIKQSEWS